ncbi:hypothetical protein E2562_034121 [Oryza meyeriana var. granulata]|uniref:DUF3475 domain-containing protein n=1 Tax=Oryza meyeriana var. granulata TaxID=110450 RepID=A0A6G1E712_9ORYZ|nr:hypothetical protein E2562_034121 [Oryza meyeriana var. granulata]
MFTSLSSRLLLQFLVSLDSPPPETPILQPDGCRLSYSAQKILDHADCRYPAHSDYNGRHRNYPRSTRESLQQFIENVLKNWRVWLERTVGCTSLETCCQQVYKCMVIGLTCVDPDPKKRPIAWDVIQMLNETESKNWLSVGQALQIGTMKSANLLDNLTIARTGASTSNTANVIVASYVDSIVGARSSTLNTESTAVVSYVPVRRSMVEIMAFGVAKIHVRGSNLMKSDGVAAGERKIGILAFEVANTIVSGSNLMKSLSEEGMRHLNEVVLQSEGACTLISEHYYQLLIILKADIRLGLLKKSREYITLESELACTKEEAVSAMQYLIKRAHYTMELYKEMRVLDKFEQEKPTAIQSGWRMSMPMTCKTITAILEAGPTIMQIQGMVEGAKFHGGIGAVDGLALLGTFFIIEATTDGAAEGTTRC